MMTFNKTTNTITAVTYYYPSTIANRYFLFRVCVNETENGGLGLSGEDAKGKRREETSHREREGETVETEDED